MKGVVFRRFSITVDFMCVSNPMVSSSIYKSLFMEIRIRSGRKELPVVRDKDRNAG